MIARFSARASALCKVLLACAFVMFCAAPLAAQSPVSMSARYAITMTHVQVGELTWVVYFSDGAYLASANGKASGIFSVLVHGEGSVTTHGRLVDGKLTPMSVTSVVTDEDGRDQTLMTFDQGALEKVDHQGPPLKGERIEVTPELLQNVVDPLTALLVPVAGDAFAQANCAKTLRIFDGRRRYNLALSFKRVDKLTIAGGYDGPVLVCGVVLRAIAGYRTDSLLVRYLGGKDDLELWFAPIAGLSIMAPIRAVMPTLIGTMELRATEFSTKTAADAPPTVPAQSGGHSDGATNCIGGDQGCTR